MNSAYFAPDEGFLSREQPVAGGRRGTPPRPSILAHYWRIAMRWRWLILCVMVTVILLAFIVTMFMTPLYKATATIEISREGNNIVNVEGLEPTEGPADLEFYETQYSLLKARSLAERVAKELQLSRSDTFFEAFGVDPDGGLFEDDAPPRLTADERQQREEMAVELLLQNIEVEPIRGSALAEVSFTSPDAELSQRVANAWTSEFIGSSLDRKYEATSYAREFLENRLEQLRKRLEDSERQLVAYASAQRIVTVQTGTSDTPSVQNPERPLLSDDLATLNAELNRAIADRIRASSRIGSGASNEMLTNQAISELRRQRGEAAAERAGLLTRFEPEYPPVEALTSKIADLDRSIAAEETRVRTTLARDYQDALRREQVLRSNVEELKSGALDLRRRNIQYEILKREADTNRQLYDALLQRYKEIGIAGGVGVNNVLVVDPANLPDSPSSPNLPLNIALGLILGVVLSGALVIALEQLDEAVKDLDNARRVLPVPILGAIPALENEEAKEALRDRKSAFSEAYLSVQTSLRFSTDHGIPKSTVVTSTRAAEGKSTTSYALAHSLVRTGKKVVMIDADMRSPSVHQLFDLRNDRGLSNFLAGEEEIDGLISPVAESGIDVIPAGPQPPNAAELLTSHRLNLLVTNLLTKYDHVIIDSPPVLGLADAPLLASQVEAVVFTVEAHGPKVGAVTAALGRLWSANANVVGAVLTKFETRKAQYGYGYEYGYGYGSSGVDDQA